MDGLSIFRPGSSISTFSAFCCSICTSCGGVMDPTFVTICSGSKHRRLHRQCIGLALLCMLLHTWYLRQLELVLRRDLQRIGWAQCTPKCQPLGTLWPAYGLIAMQGGRQRSGELCGMLSTKSMQWVKYAHGTMMSCKHFSLWSLSTLTRRTLD